MYIYNVLEVILVRAELELTSMGKDSVEGTW